MRSSLPHGGLFIAGVAVAAALAASPASAQSAFQWRRSGTGMILPRGAYVGGEEDGTPLIVCRAPYLGGVYPGKLVRGNCNISYNSREIYLHDYDVLVGRGGSWAPPQYGLGGAFIAGYERGGPLYLCQALYRGGLHPGRIYQGACDISYGGREIPIRHFNVFYIGAPEVATYGGPAYAPTVVYHYESTTSYSHYYPPSVDPRVAEAQRRAAWRQQAQQRADYERNQQLQQDLRDRQTEEQQRAAYERNQAAQRAAEEARARAEGEAEENRQALRAQAAAEDEARRAEEIRQGEAQENRMAAEAAAKAQAEEDAQRQAEIKRGEDEENRMAAEAAAKAQAEEDAHRQAEIKQGEDEENRMAAEAAAKDSEPTPPDSPPPD